MNQKTIESISNKYGTPLYIFDLDAFKKRAQDVNNAFSSKVKLCFSIKANPFLTGSLPEEFSYLEVCSPGELNICISLGVSPEKIIYSGVNKTIECIEDAIDYDVYIITAESKLHFDRICAVAKNKNKSVRVLLRLTGGDQFGMDSKVINDIIKNRKKYENIEILGLHYFTGTQKKNASIIKRELEYIDKFAEALLQDYGYNTKWLEYGPGLFADYYGENPEKSEIDLLNEVSQYIIRYSKKYKLTVEMGRFFASPCGVYLTAVADKKVNGNTSILIVDGGNHQIAYDGLMMAGKQPPLYVLNKEEGQLTNWMICGSLCSRGDMLARKAQLIAPDIGDVLVFGRAGAYGITEGMALFLSRDLPKVVIYSNETGAVLARDRFETFELNMPKKE